MILLVYREKYELREASYFLWTRLISNKIENGFLQSNKSRFQLHHWLDV